MLARLELIAHAVAALHDGPLPEKLKAQAIHEAHKLAGSLGTFGLEAGSATALRIERLLSENEVPCPIADITRHFNQLRQEIEGK
jgi:HPt (histidine-containing phosphotransfer) domain-containing protein